MIVNEKNDIIGSVSGGCIESFVFGKLLETIKTKKHSTLEFGVSNSKAWEVGLTCGGKIRLLLEYLDDKDLVTINNNGEVYLNWNMTPDFENPNDTDQDNIYEVSVSISDYRGHITNQDITIEVLDLDETFSGVRQYQGQTLIEMPETQSWNTRYVPLNPESSQYVTFKINVIYSLTN